MKKAILIIVLGLLWCNVSVADEFASFYCDTIDGPPNNIPFSIDLNKRTMKFGLVKHKINSITDETISASSPSKHNGKDFEKILNFDRYTGKLTLIHLTKPPFFWHMQCRKLDKTKKLF